MSIDIYMYAEKCENGVWRSCNPAESSLQDGEVVYDMDTVYEHHNAYELASILLKVDRIQRLGVDESARPRGLPDDLSPELKQVVAFRQEKGYCNYPSWLLLSEVLDFSWDEKATSSVELEGEEFCQSCQEFLQHTVPLLKTFGEPNDVRIVFWL